MFRQGLYMGIGGLLAVTISYPAFAVISQKDARFFEQAAVSGLFEVQAGNLAISKSADPAVQDFGQKMMTDHVAGNRKLAALAQKKGAVVPTQLDESHQKMLDKLLMEKTGESFDDEYVEQMEAGRKQTVALFEDAARSAEDADIRNFATAMLPTLKQHHVLVEDLDDRH